MNVKELSGNLQAGKARFGIVVSRFNDFFTRQLLRGALDCLARHGADEKNITIAWVPGAYEIPIAIQALARSKRFNAMIALGAVIQGATPHAGHIASQVARALNQIALAENVPVIDGVITADTIEQAVERSGTKAGNRGWSAALSAIEMADLFAGMQG